MPKRFKTAYIELTNVCNRHCPFCHGTVRPPGFMDSALFAKAAEEVEPLAEKACLHIMGEALLHPELKTIAGTANRLGLPLVLTTNGSLFTTSNAELLLTHPFRQLNISLHSGVSPEELETILSFTEEAGKRNPEMFINLRLWNVCERNSEYLSGILTRCGVASGSGWNLKRHSERLGKRLFLHFDESFVWPDLSLPECPGTGFCHGGIEQFGIFYNGDVTACCLDADGVMNFGNIRERRLSDILFSHRFERMRNAFYRGLVREELCLHCSYRDRFSDRAEKLYTEYSIKKERKNT